MNSIKFVAIVIVLAIEPSLASTNCEQTFRLLGLNWRASRVFWIAENLSGECYSSRILQVSLSDSGSTIAYSCLRQFDDWGPVDSAISRLYTEDPLIFDHQGGLLVEKGSGLRITTPRSDSSLLVSFEKHIIEGGSNGETWNRKLGLQGIILPHIEGMKSDLVFYYSAGLYVGYAVSSAYYFREAGYILIFTQQKWRAVGNDTMHGFLIFKVNQN